MKKYVEKEDVNIYFGASGCVFVDKCGYALTNEDVYGEKVLVWRLDDGSEFIEVNKRRYYAVKQKAEFTKTQHGWRINGQSKVFAYEPYEDAPLSIEELDGKYYWSLKSNNDENERYCGEEIPKSLYDELVKFCF